MEQNEEKGKAFESNHYIISHCNIHINKYLFKNSSTSWRDGWLLDTGGTCHINLQRQFFEELNENVESVV
jgi:predicted aspartyl protease